MEDIKAKAANGNPKAQESLAVCYEMGIGIPEDKVKATFWMRKAAEQGYPSAQWSLGSRAWKGVGMDKDLIEDAKWLKLAALVGFEDKYGVKASQTLADVIREMTQAQKEKAGVENLVYLPPPKSSDAIHSINDRKLLEGVNGVSISVEVQDENNREISERLETMVELRLRTAGIKVRNDSTLTPRFVLRLHALHYKQDLTFFSITGALQDFSTYNKLLINNIELWRKARLSYVGNNLYDGSVIETAQTIVDQFANDLLAANQKQ